MEGSEVVDQQDQLQKYRSFIVGQLKSGAEASAVIQRLVAMGVEQNEAVRMVQTVQGDTALAAGGEALASPAIFTGLIGGVVAALMGGAIWGFIVKVTGYEIGFMAWGIGLLCGIGVLIFSGGKRGIPFQVIAVLASVFGILVGKYAAFYFLLKDMIIEKHGAEAAAKLSFFSSKVVNFFLTEVLRDTVGGFDIVWVILAVITAWGILHPANAEAAG